MMLHRLDAVVCAVYCTCVHLTVCLPVACLSFYLLVCLSPQHATCLLPHLSACLFSYCSRCFNAAGLHTRKCNRGKKTFNRWECPCTHLNVVPFDAKDCPGGHKYLIEIGMVSWEAFINMNINKRSAMLISTQIKSLFLFHVSLIFNTRYLYKTFLNEVFIHCQFLCHVPTVRIRKSPAIFVLASVRRQVIIRSAFGS